MKIIEAINKIDALVPNDYTYSEKVAWLSECDFIIKREIIDTHEDSDLVSFSGYTEDTSVDTTLIATEPYSALYLAYLEAQINYYNHEFTKYNNAIAIYQNNMSAYRNYYNSIHLPLTKSITHY